jgi:hypothetical protein
LTGESLSIQDQFGNEFSFGSDPFRCIIAHLTDKCTENVHDHDVVAPTEARQFGGDYAPNNAAHPISQSGFFSCGALN